MTITEEHRALALELIQHDDLFGEGDIPVELVARALAAAEKTGRALVVKKARVAVEHLTELAATLRREADAAEGSSGPWSQAARRDAARRYIESAETLADFADAVVLDIEYPR